MNTEATYPRDMCIHSLFEAQAERTPDAIAVVFGSHEVTYRELNERSNQLAHYLRRLGVKPDELVGIRVERSIEMMVGVLGILKAGGAYVPLDPTYPLERLAYMLRDSRAALLLTQAKLRQNLPGDCHILYLDKDRMSIAEEENSNLDSDLSAENLAYVMYTSGSTGRPKGVEVPHRGVVRLVCGQTYARFTANEVFLQMAPLAFDASTFEIWGALLHGARLVVLPPQKPTLEQIGWTIQNHKITTLWLTAGLFHLMVEERLEDLKGLRHLVAGGDVLSPTHVQRAVRVLSDGRLINGYGPTESTTFACCYSAPPESHHAGSVPIGKPIANTQVYILDAYLQPVPVGGVGELHIGGDGLARGYLNRPELTAERFISHPFSAEQGARLYKTGDLGRYLPDGNIEFLGRMDQQVKIRGFRVEPEEIEAALRRHPGVSQCIVVAREDEAGNKQLVAYAVAPAGQQRVSINELRRLSASQLPDYMIPNAFIWLETIPLTPNGKVDRNALPATELERGNFDAGYVAPRTSTEEVLAEIWSKILRLERVGVQDTFCNLGGQSLGAMRVIDEVRKSFDQELSVELFFRDPTIEEMAKVLENEKQSKSEGRLIESSSCVVPIRPEGSTPPLFLIHGMGGTILGFCELANHLEQSQRLYGIEYASSDSGSAALSVEDLAAGYLQEIQKVQSEGPYHLLGYSFGGLLAFEMAQQLRSRGQTVSFLGILDTVLANSPIGQDAPHSPIQAARRMVQALNFHTRRFFRAPQLRARARALVYASLSAVGLPVPKVLECAYAVNWLAERRYHARPYPGCVTLFRVTPGEDDVDERYGIELGWKSVAGGGVELRELPGTHHSIVRDPHVRFLANEVTACLNLRYWQSPNQKRFLQDGRGPNDRRSSARLPSEISI